MDLRRWALDIERRWDARRLRRRSGRPPEHFRIDTYLGYVWGAFIIALFIALGFMPVHGIKATYFFLMVLYGIATFVSCYCRDDFRAWPLARSFWRSKFRCRTSCFALSPQ